MATTISTIRPPPPPPPTTTTTRPQTNTHIDEIDRGLTHRLTPTTTTTTRPQTDTHIDEIDRGLAHRLAVQPVKRREHGDGERHDNGQHGEVGHSQVDDVVVGG